MTKLTESAVRDIMTSPPLTATPDETLMVALRRMHENGVSCLIVCLESGHGWGVLTHKDAMSLMGTGEIESVLEGTTVGDVMTAPAVTMPPHYRIDTALDLMRMLGIRRAPVVAGGELLGVVSFTDIFRRTLAGLF